jgi:predicted nucleic-acid-binding protein
MRAVDTNVLVRLITGDNEDQVAAAEAFVRNGAWVSHLVLAEVTWVLRTGYNQGHHAVASAIEMLLNQEQLTIQDADVAAAALLQYRKKPSLGFSDCLVLEIARKAGHLPLCTFDNALSKLPGAERL